MSEEKEKKRRERKGYGKNDLRSVRDNAFQWRAGRLLLTHNALLQGENGMGDKG